MKLTIRHNTALLIAALRKAVTAKADSKVTPGRTKDSADDEQ